MLPHKQHGLGSLLQIEVLRPGNIALSFALTHLFLNIDEEGHVSGILWLPAVGIASVFALEFAAVFCISGDNCGQIIHRISIPQRAEEDQAFLIRAF